jgi:hypothetical protein
MFSKNPLEFVIDIQDVDNNSISQTYLDKINGALKSLKDDGLIDNYSVKTNKYGQDSSVMFGGAGGEGSIFPFSFFEDNNNADIVYKKSDEPQPSPPPPEDDKSNIDNTQQHITHIHIFIQDKFYGMNLNGDKRDFDQYLRTKKDHDAKGILDTLMPTSA